MALYEVQIKLEHDCPYTTFSRNLPEVVVQHWCNQESDLLEFVLHPGIDREKLESELRLLKRTLHARFVRRIPSGPNRSIVVQRHSYSSMGQNVNAMIEAHSCMEIQPTTYRGGYEWYRILAFSQTDLISLFGALSKTADLSVVSRKALSEKSPCDSLTISTRLLLGGMTAKQLASLSVAIASGYYDTPSRIRTEDLSERLGSPRTTFETHLRKAEGKVMRAILPYIELKVGEERED